MDPLLEEALRFGPVFGHRPVHYGGMALMVFLGVPLLLLRLVAFIVLFIVAVLIVLLSSKLGCKRFAVGVMRFACRGILWCFGFLYISHSGAPPEVPANGCVLVANHVGVVDILWMLYWYAPGFVAKEGVRKLPGIGHIAEHLLDAIFVDRAGGGAARTGDAILKYFEKSQTSGRRLCIFPEGTSTSCNHVISFRTGAFLPPLAILPHAIRLNFCAGCQFDPHYTDVPLGKYLLGLMCNPYNRMHVQFLSPVPFIPSESRGQRVEKVRSNIAAALGVPLTTANFDDKLAYQNSVGLK